MCQSNSRQAKDCPKKIDTANGHGKHQQLFIIVLGHNKSGEEVLRKLLDFSPQR
jgi:hypothetical protein